MTNLSTVWMVALVALVVAFPQESTDFAVYIYARVALFYMNRRMRWTAWRTHQRLKRDFAKHGIEIPEYRPQPIRLDDEP